MLKKILLLLGIAIVVGGAIGFYYFNKRVPSMATEKSELAIDAAQLYQEFETNEAAASAKYVGKIITVSGAVLESSELDDGTPKILLDTGSDFSVSCEFDPNTRHAKTTFQPGEKIAVKGMCAGFNLDVQLSRCVVE